MKHKFRVGERVRIKESIPQDYLDRMCSSGKRGVVYTIEEIEGSGSLSILLAKSNWHDPEWLESVAIKNKVGGTIL